MRVSERENVRVPESGSESERKCAKRMCVCVHFLYFDPVCLQYHRCNSLLRTLKPLLM